MSEFIKMYLTEFNAFAIGIVLFVILLVLSAIFAAKDCDKSLSVSLSLLFAVVFFTILILISSRYEIESSTKWTQLYPSKENVSKISLKFEDDSMSQQLDSNVVSDTLYSVKNYHDDPH